MWNRFKIVDLIIAALSVQLWIFLCSLPIVIWAGFPIAPGMLLGNLIWVPFFTLFLMIGFLVWVGAFWGFSVPLAWALNGLTELWIAGSDCMPGWAIWYLPRPPLILLACIPLSACWALKRFALEPRGLLGVLCILSIAWPFALALVPCWKRELSCVYRGHELIYIRQKQLLIDGKGVLGMVARDVRHLSRLGIGPVKTVWLGRPPRDIALFVEQVGNIGITQVCGDAKGRFGGQWQQLCALLSQAGIRVIDIGPAPLH